MGKRKKTPQKIEKTSGFSPPVLAFVTQLLSLCLTVSLACFLVVVLGWTLDLWVLAVIQGSLAGIFSFLRRLPYWWLPIQFLFPLALVFFLSLQIPPIWFLTGFVLLLIVYWGVVVTRVPLYLSTRELWQEVERLLPDNKAVRFVDIGSGLGGLVAYLAQKRPDSSFLGIEISPLPWMVSKIRLCLTDSPGEIRYANYEYFSLAEYDVVFAYLSPVVMDALWMKAKAEMRTGALFLSYEFPVLSVRPDIMLPIGNSVLYGWHL